MLSPFATHHFTEAAETRPIDFYFFTPLPLLLTANFLDLPQIVSFQSTSARDVIVSMMKNIADRLLLATEFGSL